MNRPLFRFPKVISDEHVVEKMNHFISDSTYALEHYQADNVTMLKLARELREEIKVENKHNNLRRTKKHYDSNELFLNNYKPAIYNASVFVKGQYNIEKAYSFLCNLQKEMNTNLPKKKNKRIGFRCRKDFSLLSLNLV